ncbi:MAG: hypothetical protein PGN25_09150 [Methylorubrum populi]
MSKNKHGFSDRCSRATKSHGREQVNLSSRSKAKGVPELLFEGITRMRKTCFGALAGLALFAGLSAPARAENRTAMGVGAGAVAGALVAGPVGAVVGAVAGGVIGSNSGARPRSARKRRAAVRRPMRTTPRRAAMAEPPAARSETLRPAVGSTSGAPVRSGWQDPR